MNKKNIEQFSTISKIIYPNGKIYISSDYTADINYFGSVNSDLIAQDFDIATLESFTITKVILWRGITTLSRLRSLECKFIKELHSNDPKIGYNRSPKFKPAGSQLITQ